MTDKTSKTSFTSDLSEPSHPKIYVSKWRLDRVVAALGEAACPDPVWHERTVADCAKWRDDPCKVCKAYKEEALRHDD